jgi:putative ABC transport system permease protein
MRVPLRRGRYFNTFDRADGLRVVLVNEQFAKRYYAGADPVGRRLRYPGNNSAWYTIVGVTAGEPAGGMDEEPKPMVYFSMEQSPWTFFHLIVKTNTDLDNTILVVKQALHKISPSIAPYEIRLLDRMVLDSTWRVRYSMMLLTALAVVALVLAALGVYGVLRYAVSKRTREIGIRMALGAERRSILGMVLRDGLTVACAGVLAGIAGASILTRFLSSLLFGVHTIEPLTFAAVSGFLLAVAAGACLGPAIRASRLPPVEAAERVTQFRTVCFSLPREMLRNAGKRKACLLPGTECERDWLLFYTGQAKAYPTISAPMASDAVAAGLGALRTCRALGRAMKRKSCTRSPSGAMAWARTPEPPVARSST